MKYVFIVNPKSGNGKGFEIVQKLKEMCLDKEIEYDIYYTSKKMDATNIVKRYFYDENAVIFSIGGDGTLNEIVQSISGAKCKLEVIPSGTGNDFYNSLSDINQTNKKIDLGHVNKDFFINTMSIGIDAVICKNAEYLRTKKYIPSKQMYNAGILYTLFNYKPYNLDIFINHEKVAEKSDEIWLLAICNGTTYGRGFKIAPNAKLDDGLLDVYLVKNISRVKLPKLILKLLKGKHESCEEILHFQTDKVHIKADDEILCCIDGEMIDDKEFKVTVCKDAVTLNNDKMLLKQILAPNIK